MARKSKLDGYGDVLSECVGMGLSLVKIQDYLYENYELDVCSTAIYWWLKKHHVDTKRAIELKNIPHCDGCEHTVVITGAYSDTDFRCCMNKKKVILNNVVTSPLWCPLREGINVGKMDKDNN